MCRVVRAATLVAAFVFVASSARGACPDTCARGGGSKTADCVVEFDGIAPNAPANKPKRLRCVDGDPACDTDGTPNGACRLLVSVCPNVSDPGLPTCTPSDLASFEVDNPNEKDELSALQASATALGLPTGATACGAPVPVYVNLQGKNRFSARTKKIRTTATTSAGTTDRDTLSLTCVPSDGFRSRGDAYAVATVITTDSERIDGPLSRGQLGDILLASDHVQVVIQAAGRVMFGIGTYGGTIIDADRQRPGAEERDSFEELAPLVNVENAVNYTDVTILNDGSDGRAAIVRATGVDDLLDYVNPSTIVADAGFAFPPSIDDRDLPITVQTDYILEPGASTIRIETTLMNDSAAPLDLFFGDIMNGSGQVELFQDPYGFGEPLVTLPCSTEEYAPCGAGMCDPCNFLAWSGDQSAAGVSYGYVHEVNGSTSFTVSGVSASLLGNQVLLVLIGLASPNFHLDANGSLMLTRHFVIGDGSVRSITDARNLIQRVPVTTITGLALEDADADGDVDDPVEGVEVSVTRPGTVGSTLTRVVTQTRTDERGEYRVTVAPGKYSVSANVEGRLFATPSPETVDLVAGRTAIADFSLRRPAKLEVKVTDEAGMGIPAKVQLVGFDMSPDPARVENIAGVITNVTHTFGDMGDGLSYGVAAVFYANRDGTTGVVDVEPGRYQVVVSHGTRYSHYTETVVLAEDRSDDVVDENDDDQDEDAPLVIEAKLARTIATPGFITSDYHLHALDSPDSEVSREGRVASQLAEGIDFFTPSEHDIQVDFQPIVEAMGVADLIATAPGTEITTFDYGHFNSWPKTVDPTSVNGGSPDWGRAGIPAGMDFPSHGSYGLTPGEIFDAALADPRTNIIQINHVDSFFGATGLDIDTALTPPQSFTTATSRRLDPSVTNFFDDGFQALEIWNGNIGVFLGQNIGDWFNLLNQGIVRTGVATSDSHEFRSNSGGTRTLLASTATDAPTLVAQADVLATTVAAGRAVGTNGPTVTIALDATSTGDHAELALGSPLLAGTTDGQMKVTVVVASPLWAEFDAIELYVNNAPQPYDHDGDAGTRNRYRVIPDLVQTAGVDFTRSTTANVGGVPNSGHFAATATFTLSGVAADSWVVALVKGTSGLSKPLFPIVPGGLDPALNPTFADLIDGNVGDGGDQALAFTNPLFIDADADDLWTAPGVTLTPP